MAEPVTSRLRLPAYPQTSKFAFMIFLAFVVARYIQINARLDLLSTIRFEFVLGGIASALAVVQLSSRRPENGASGRLMAAIALLFAAMIIQLPFAADPKLARDVFSDRVFKFAILTFLMVVFVESPRYLRLFMAAFLFAVFYITLESVRGLISGGLIWENQGTMRLHGAVPIYRHPNSLGGVALGGLPFLWYYWGEFRNVILRIAILAMATTSTVCVIYSGSRTAYVGLLGLVFWFWGNAKRKGRFFVNLLIVGAIVVMIIPRQYIERFQSITGEEKESHSKDARKEILWDAWTIFLENPLGVGVASFPAVRTQRFGRSQDTHNLYLEVGTNLGVQGLAVFGFLAWTMMAAFAGADRGFRRWRAQIAAIYRQGRLPRDLAGSARLLDKELSFLAATAKAGGGFIFVRLVLGLFGMDLYEIYWWFGAGLAIILSGVHVRVGRRFRAWESAVIAQRAQTDGDPARL